MFKLPLAGILNLAIPFLMITLTFMATAYVCGLTIKSKILKNSLEYISLSHKEILY